MKSRFVWAALLLLASILTPSAARADGLPAYVTFQYNKWLFAPVVVSGEVRGFFCVHSADEIIGNNVDLVWYERTSNRSYAGYAWSGESPGEAVRYLRAYYGDDTLFENEPRLSAAAAGTTGYAEPFSFVKGLFANDPIQEFVASSDHPVQVMETLVDVGWFVAPDLSKLAVSTPVDCAGDIVDPVKQFLDEAQAEVETALFGAATIDVTCMVDPCKGCRTEYGPKVPVPGGHWTFTGSGTYNGGWTLCYYDFPATQHWEKKGVDKDCSTCSGSGDVSCTIFGTVSVAPGQSCHEPAAPASP